MPSISSPLFHWVVPTVTFCPVATVSPAFAETRPLALMVLNAPVDGVAPPIAVPSIVPPSILTEVYVICERVIVAFPKVIVGSPAERFHVHIIDADPPAAQVRSPVNSVGSKLIV